MKCPLCDNILYSNSEGAYCLSCNSYWGLLELAMTEPARDPLLIEREKTHGSFHTNARIAQAIKIIFHENIEPCGFRDVHREALDMIALKLSRILSGQANFKDHWEDISGYAKLASEACDK